MVYGSSGAGLAGISKNQGRGSKQELYTSGDSAFSPYNNIQQHPFRIRDRNTNDNHTDIATTENIIITDSREDFRRRYSSDLLEKQRKEDELNKKSKKDKKHKNKKEKRRNKTENFGKNKYYIPPIKNSVMHKYGSHSGHNQQNQNSTHRDYDQQNYGTNNSNNNVDYRSSQQHDDPILNRPKGMSSGILNRINKYQSNPGFESIKSRSKIFESGGLGAQNHQNHGNSSKNYHTQEPNRWTPQQEPLASNKPQSKEAEEDLSELSDDQPSEIEEMPPKVERKTNQSPVRRSPSKKNRGGPPLSKSAGQGKKTAPIVRRTSGDEAPPPIVARSRNTSILSTRTRSRMDSHDSHSNGPPPVERSGRRPSSTQSSNNNSPIKTSSKSPSKRERTGVQTLNKKSNVEKSQPSFGNAFAKFESAPQNVPMPRSGFSTSYRQKEQNFGPVNPSRKQSVTNQVPNKSNNLNNDDDDDTTGEWIIKNGARAETPSDTTTLTSSNTNKELEIKKEINDLQKTHEFEKQSATLELQKSEVIIERMKLELEKVKNELATKNAEVDNLKEQIKVLEETNLLQIEQSKAGTSYTSSVRDARNLSVGRFSKDENSTSKDHDSNSAIQNQNKTHYLLTVIALYPYQAKSDDEISFQQGDKIKVIRSEIGEAGWMHGENMEGQQGLFPDNYVANEVVVKTGNLANNESIATDNLHSTNNDNSASKGKSKSPARDPNTTLKQREESSQESTQDQSENESDSTSSSNNSESINDKDILSDGSEDMEEEDLLYQTTDNAKNKNDTQRDQKFYIAKFGFEGSAGDELTFQKNDEILLIDANIDEIGWSHGKNLRTGLEGIYPDNYVKEKEVTSLSRSISRKQSMKKSQRDKKMSKDKREKRISKDISDIKSRNKAAKAMNGTKNQKSSFDLVDGILSNPGGNSNSTSDATDKEQPDREKLEIVIARYPYQATRDDELSFAKNDKIGVLTKTTDEEGWWCGKHLISGSVGIFPGNYMKEEKRRGKFNSNAESHGRDLL